MFINKNVINFILLLIKIFKLFNKFKFNFLFNPLTFLPQKI